MKIFVWLSEILPDKIDIFILIQNCIATDHSSLREEIIPNLKRPVSGNFSIRFLRQYVSLFASVVTFVIEKVPAEKDSKDFLLEKIP